MQSNTYFQEHKDFSENMADKGQVCDDCRPLFDSTYDVQKHVKSGCFSENRDQKKRKHVEMSDSDHDEGTEDMRPIYGFGRESNNLMMRNTI